MSNLRHMNDIKYAAIQIQRLFRGFSLRLYLRQFDTPFSNHYAKKIQRRFLLYLFRIKSLERFYISLCIKSTRIKLCYLQYRSRQILYQKRHQQRIQRITVIQSLYRRKLARRELIRKRFLWHTHLAIIIQSHIRGLLHRTYSKRIRIKYNTYKHCLVSRYDPTSMRYGSVAQTRWIDGWMGVRDILLYSIMRSNPSRQVLSHLRVLLSLHPNWHIPRQLFTFFLLIYWNTYSRIHVTSEDLLEEALGVWLSTAFSPSCLEDSREITDIELTILSAYFNAYVTSEPCTMRLWRLAWVASFHGRDQSSRLCRLITKTKSECYETVKEASSVVSVRLLLDLCEPSQSYRVFLSPIQTLVEVDIKMSVHSRRRDVGLIAPENVIVHVRCELRGGLILCVASCILKQTDSPTNKSPSGRTSSRAYSPMHSPATNIESSISPLTVRPLLVQVRHLRHIINETSTLSDGIISAYLTDNLNILKTGGSLSAYRLFLPALESLRRDRLQTQLRFGSAQEIQRYYRGFVSRNLHKRLLHRQQSLLEQKKKMNNHRAYVDKYIDLRNRAAVIIQRIFRGGKLRTSFKAMIKSAIVIQRVFLKLLRRLRAAAEEKRKLNGPAVIEVLRQGVCVGGRSVNAVISRCEGQFKVTAYDLIRSTTYQGFCYEDEVQSILADYNLHLPIALRVKQHRHEEVARVLLSRLKMAYMDEDTDLHLDVNCSNKTFIWISSERTRGMVGKTSRVFERSLQDQSAVLEKYRKIIRQRR